MNIKYQICKRCVMDTSDKDIVFDEKGICNHCRSYEALVGAALQVPPMEKEKHFSELIANIKREGEGHEYDCVIGVSGGVDSSYLAYIAKKHGLRPLAVHIDNGWNSELAVKNIENIVKKLEIDLFTHVIEWEEFKDLQLAFFRASVIDIEMLSDNAIFVGIYKSAKKYGIKYALNGANYATELVMPPSWLYTNKYDSMNIMSIYKRYGSGRKIRTFPLLNLFEYLRYRAFTDVKEVSLLNYIDYSRDHAVAILKNELGWKDYGGKHWESKFTQFYQAYILPVKFGVDKRRAHLSSLILSGQMTRAEAMEKMEEDHYPEAKMREDKEYVLKKWGIKESEFDEIMMSPAKSHYDFPSYNYWYMKLWALKNFIKRFFTLRP